MMLNSQWLNTFLTLVDIGHFTQTAEKLYMTQPGVSQHIKKLEAQVGTPLLIRIGKRFELTAAGETLYRYGLKRLEEENSVLSSLQEDDAHQGECRFACSGSMAMYLYPHFLERQRHAPGLTLSMEAAPNHKIINDIKENRVDIGIITHPVDTSEFEQTAIGSESLCVVAPAQYPIEENDLSALYQLGFINHPDGKHYLQQIHQANYPDEHFDFNSITLSGYVNQLGQILLPVAQGLGFTVLPEKAVRMFPNQDAIQVISLHRNVEQQLYLIVKKHRPLAKRYTFFIELINDLIKRPS